MSLNSKLPTPLRRLRIYAQREEVAKRLFNGHESSVFLQASVPTIPALSTFGGGVPEVILIGRANVGKSSLVNHIFKRKKLANTGTTAGRTQSLNFYRLRKNSTGRGPEFIVVDGPGYGERGRPEWGKLFEHYIRHREELRRIYVVINAEHGVTEYDKLMLERLELECQSHSFMLQAILSKCDRVPPPLLPQVMAQRQQAIFECSPSCLPPIFTSSGTRMPFGIQDVRHSILEACGHTPQLLPPWQPI